MPRHFYGPKSALKFPLGIETLRSSRNEAAKAIFQPVDARVHDYASATARGHIGDKPLPSLYSLCSSAAKSTEVWQHRIGLKIDVSKAARTVFVFAVLALVITVITPVRELTKADPYIQRLGFLAQPWFECTLALVALVAYVALRVQHNVELFEYVAKNVTHLPVKDKTAAIVFDVVLSHDAPSDE
jgi:hypothetical protein